MVRFTHPTDWGREPVVSSGNDGTAQGRVFAFGNGRIIGTLYSNVVPMPIGGSEIKTAK